jgi:hypothetical protein
MSSDYALTIDIRGNLLDFNPPQPAQPWGPIFEISCPARLLTDIHTRGTVARTCRYRRCPPPMPKTRVRPAFRARLDFSSCTKSCHPAVDRLHSIENKLDRGAYFLLTSKSEGVQQDRSLTVS